MHSLTATSITLDPRLAGASGAAVVCVLLLLQYAHRRSPFILAWTAGWLLLVPALLLAEPPYSSAFVARLAAGVSQLFVVGAAVLVFWSADLFRHTRYLSVVRWQHGAAAAAWLIAAPQLVWRPLLVPGALAAPVVLVAAAWMYGAIVVERRLIGAGLVAFVLIGIAISTAATALFLPQTSAGDSATVQVFVVNAVLAILGAIGVHLLVFEDMTYELRVANRRLEAAREELVQAAITDQLTGCHNRRFLEQVVDRELRRHARFKQPLSLLFVDVNRFKTINDTLGHDAGDRVLQYVARFLKRRIREADYVFRWGGDEFLVMMTCSTSEARKKAAALKAAFDAEPEMVDLPPGVGLSIGAIGVPPGTTDLMPILNEADRRMYKDKGR